MHSGCLSEAQKGIGRMFTAVFREGLKPALEQIRAEMKSIARRQVFMDRLQIIGFRRDPGKRLFRNHRNTSDPSAASTFQPELP